MSQSDDLIHLQAELESRLTYVDDSLEQLSAVVARQDAEIRELRVALAKLARRLQDLGESVGPGISGSQVEIPPHY